MTVCHFSVKCLEPQNNSSNWRNKYIKLVCANMVAIRSSYSDDLITIISAHTNLIYLFFQCELVMNKNKISSLFRIGSWYNIPGLYITYCVAVLTCSYCMLLRINTAVYYVARHPGNLVRITRLASYHSYQLIANYYFKTWCQERKSAMPWSSRLLRWKAHQKIN